MNKKKFIFQNKVHTSDYHSYVTNHSALNHLNFCYCTHDNKNYLISICYDIHDFTKLVKLNMN